MSTTKVLQSELTRRIHILGAGNIGKYIAYSLKKHAPRLPVTLLLHRAALLKEWDAAGRAILCTAGGPEGKTDRAEGIDVDLVTESGAGSQAPISHLVVACKTYMTTTALRPVRHLLGPQSSVLFLQNGMGTVEEVTRDLFPEPSSRPNFWAGVCVAGIFSTSPFSIVHAGKGSLALGPIPPPAPDTNTPTPITTTTTQQPEDNFLINTLLQNPLLQATALPFPELLKAQLLKLVANAVINPLTAIFACKNGDLLDSGPRLDLMKAMLREIAPVVRELLPYNDADAEEERGGEDGKDGMEGGASYLEAFSDEKLLEYVLLVTQRTGANTSSMAQDVRAGRPTEIDYINGYIVAQAERLGMECSNNETVVDMVRTRKTITNDDIPVYFQWDPRDFADTELDW